VPVPEWLQGSVLLGEGVLYPVYRFAIIAAGLGVALGLWVLIEKTRIGMLVRAGASNAPIVSALGVDISRLFMIVFAFGAMLASFAGAMAAPILSVEPGMGDSVLILAFVVIVIGGIGSIRGALVGAVLVGVVDTIGRAFLPLAFGLVFQPRVASAAGPAIASVSIYLLMAVILYFKPKGLFPARG
jgi:branched-chain amino acid transport system permease protein